MKTQNVPGNYSSVLVHLSHFGQLAIGGAMIDRVYDEGDLGDAQHDDSSACLGNGGWNTRFDGYPNPRSLVAMYAEGLGNFYEYNEDYYTEIRVSPICYAAVLFRIPEVQFNGKFIQKAQERTIYLVDRRFNFACTIAHNGVYDLKYAFDLAANGRDTSTVRAEQESRRDVLRLSNLSDRHEYYSIRHWELIPKCHVPSNVRQHLHRTLVLTRTTLDSQFGQGADFFKPKGNKGKKK